MAALLGDFGIMSFHWITVILLVTTITISVRAEEKEENAVSRSYINTHSQSWHSFALAKDIDKRAKLKKALRDALNSVDTKSDSSSNSEQSSIARIQHAAMLLKEFQQIHKLSETVKRTFVDYEEAKNSLSKTIHSDDGVGILKRFLLKHSKRTFVPHAEEKSRDVGSFVMRNMILDKPHFLKHTDKVSVIATPLKDAGDVGVEFISVDPKTSTPGRATKAFKAAKVLLKYIDSRKTRKDEHIDRLVESLRNDIDGLYKESKYMTEKKKKSLLANKASLFIEKDDKPFQPKHQADSSPTRRRLVSLGALKQNIPMKPTNTVEKTKVKNSDKKSDLEKEQEDTEKLKDEVKEEIKDTSEQHSSKAKQETNDEVLENTLKNEQTIRTLKEAKMARQKYEIARHELAVKVKELYKMANQYEKDETDNQILEVKNDNIPKSDHISNSINMTEDNVHVPHTKRDDAHPGMALSGVSQHTIKGISTATQIADGPYRGYTMGSNDKKEHQVTVKGKDMNEKPVRISALMGSKKALDETPSNQKVEELHDEVGKNMKTQEESLKVIAEAIKEDMKDIADVNKKKKLLSEALSGSPGEKKDQDSNSKIDEYLTKALTDIMGSDASYGSPAGKEAEEKMKEKAEENKNTNEQNMKIVAEAMKATNPNVALPLISKSGDKITLNGNNNDGKSQQRDTSDIMQHVSDHDSSKGHSSSPLDFNDPSNKALLEKAVHLEEQVAAQQDKLYKGQITTSDTPEKPNIAVTPDQPGASSSASSASPTSSASSKSPEEPKKGDAYSSIKETRENPEERGRMEEEPDDYDDDDDDEDDDYDDKRRHHHYHRPRYDDDEDDDDDDEDDEDNDKRGHVNRYHDENDKKRSFKDKPIKPTANAESNIHTGQPHFDNLEDFKRSSIPKKVGREK